MSMLRRGSLRLALAAMASAGFISPASAATTTYGYGMDETSGTVMRGSGGAPNGAISGDVRLGVAGVSGTAYAFNQTVGSCDSSWNVTGTGAVVIPSSSAFDVGTQPFRFSVWLNTTTVPGADSGASKDCDFDVWRRAASWKMEVIPKGTAPNLYGVPLCVWNGVRGGTATHVALTNKSVAVTDGRWHQVTCSRTKSGEQLLVDGTVAASSSVNLGAINTTAKIYVGTQAGGGDYYEGSLDDLTFAKG
jgi:hypothetical protein